jgi:Flp pilus assembly pilin Flp
MLKRLTRGQDGTATIEFAIVLSVMLVMFIGAYVVSDMIACYRKVTTTTRALTDLVSRSVSPSVGTSTTTITTYINSAGLVLSPLPRPMPRCRSRSCGFVTQPMPMCNGRRPKPAAPRSHPR